MSKGSLLVSIPKSGTHLTLKLYGRAGYLQYGWGEIPESEHAMPRPELARRMMAHPPLMDVARKFRYVRPELILGLWVRHLRMEIGDMPSMRRAVQLDPGLQAPWAEIARAGHDGLFLPGLVVSTHDFAWEDAHPRMIAYWGEDGVPGIVYGYRDPRAQIVSMIHFLRDNEEVAQHPIVQVYRPILRSLGGMDEALDFAIADKGFPFRDAYRRNRWLLLHPNVLKIRFEDLVGEEGGGTSDKQREVVGRWADFLDVETPVDELCEGLFGGTKTFRAGRVEGWREAFKPRHEEAFVREFGDVLADYGYA